MASNFISKTVLTEKNYLAESKMRQHECVIDEPLDLGGGDYAPTPIEYLLTALGGCVSITLRMYSERKGWDLGKISVDVSQEEIETDSGKKKVLVENISFEKPITDEQKKRLFDIAGKCPVAKMLKGETTIETIINS